MAKRTKFAGAGAAVALTVGLCVLAALRWSAERTAAQTDVAAEAAIARITAESRTGRTAPRTAAPPPAARPRAPARPIREMAVPAPPPGHSFTVHHGAMAAAPVDPEDYAPERDVTDRYRWLEDPDALDALVRQARAAGRGWTFGWIGVTPGPDGNGLPRRLAALGARQLGRTGNLLRARLPGDAERLERLARLSGVAAVAATPPALKMPPGLAAAAARSSRDRVPVQVTLMENDATGLWRKALEELGGVVGVFDPAIRVYPVVLPRDALSAVAAADFVLSVEPVRHATPTNDSAVPAMGADALRRFVGAGAIAGIGGASVPVGVMDTGLNVNHEAIGAGRRSICGGNFVADFFASPRAEDQDLWIDAGLHGTHVTGILAGNGAGAPHFSGTAPLVRDIRFAKVLSSAGSGTSTGIARGMDFLARPSACGAAGAPAVRAALVNMSLSLDDFEWAGLSADERKLDSIVWAHRQLYVVAQSNAAFLQYGNFASAKNSLAVGAVEDGGDLASFSSHGPTADGRLKPQVVAAGVRVFSAVGEGRRNGYHAFSGTSMASPSVAGVAALLMDAVPALVGEPAAVRARLMASAVRPDAFLERATGFPPHNDGGPGTLQHRYGLGKVSARTSVLNRDAPDGWTGGSAVLEIGDGEYGYRDIEVPAGASRLDIVMTWDERPADTLAGAVLNDLDLWVDRGADCGRTRAACGEAASRSTRDTVEWLILRNPPAGVYRAKVVPKHARVDAPRAALAWTVIRGPSTPQLSVDVDTDTVRTAPGEPFRVRATLSTDGYVAAGTTLRVDCRGASDSPTCERAKLVAARASEASREDGMSRKLRGEPDDGIALGELAAGERQRVELVFHAVPEPDRFRLYLTATAWNATSASTSFEVVVGAPGLPVTPPAATPSNDHWSGAERVSGDFGTGEADLLLATPEPGEPPFSQSLLDGFGDFQSTERPRSVWYRFRAPDTDTYRFTVAKAAAEDLADDVQLDLFETRGGRGARALPLVHAGTKRGGGLTFAARRNREYAIRLGIARDRLFDHFERFDEETGEFVRERTRRRSLVPLSVHWQLARRPANDDFELAEALTAGDGQVRRNNQAATQQSGERLQPLAATVWYRWTAPPGSDEDWRFSVDRRHLVVAAFTGERVGELRLVSGFPGGSATFPAAGGAEYRILIAAADAGASGTDYALTWGPGGRPNWELGANDDMERAEPIAGEASSEHVASVDLFGATVEPGEPVESGTRTLWWSWDAPADGTYTWRGDALSGDGLQMAAFASGDPPVPLARAVAERSTRLEFSFTAAANRRTLFSVGLPADAALLPVAGGTVRFDWGPTPANDDFAGATALAGGSGSVTGQGRYATVAPGERTALLGDASLWWTWEAPADEWYRFELDEGGSGILAAYRIAGDGGLEDTPLAVGRWLGRPALLLRAEAGVRYALRVGFGAHEEPGAFTLTWSENGPPAWLRYAGALRNGHVDAVGQLAEVASPGSIAFNADGDEMYVATAPGLQAYRRDPVSGALTHLQTLQSAHHDARLFWDAGTASLIVAACGGWRRHTRAADGAGLAEGTRIDGAAPCPEVALLRGPRDSLIHLADPSGVTTLRLVDDRGTLAEVGRVSLAGITAAAIHPAGEHVYARTAEGLHVLARDADTGALHVLHTVDDAADGDLGVGDAAGGRFAMDDLPERGLLTVDAAGGYLLAVGASRTMAAFDLDDPAMPRALVRGHTIERSPFDEGGPCVFSGIRAETLTADLVCPDTAYSVRLLPDAPALRTEDILHRGGMDAFGNNLPRHPLGRDAAASPDGRHIYATDQDAILVFERVGGARDAAR